LKKKLRQQNSFVRQLNGFTVQQQEVEPQQESVVLSEVL
jgi:hypothetical protein